MTYLCIFGKYSDELVRYLTNTGFTENMPITTDKSSKLRAKYVSEKEYAQLQEDGCIDISFKLKDDSIFGVIKPFGNTRVFQFCDIATYRYLKKKFKKQVITLHIVGNTDEYENRLSQTDTEEYSKVANIEIDGNCKTKEMAEKIEEYLGRANNENMFKLYDNDNK